MRSDTSADGARASTWRRSAAVMLLAAAASLATVASPALAHENEVIRFGSFLGGLTHPVLGLDHLLAMLAVGIVSAQIGGRAIWTVPGTFVAVMAAGGGIGLVSAAIPMTLVEGAIGFSVLLLGTIIALGRALPVRVAMAAVAFFAFFHGYAHGVETPTIAGPVRYALGFLTGTALIHLVGVLIGDVARRYRGGGAVLRVAGAAAAVVGVLFLTGVL
jgi:urease accessory protein